MQGKDITEDMIRYKNLQDAKDAWAEYRAKINTGELVGAYMDYDAGVLYFLVEEGRGYRETFIPPMTKTQAKGLIASMTESYRAVRWTTNTNAEAFDADTKTKVPNVFFRLEELDAN
jgi:hypothetical protein